MNTEYRLLQINPWLVNTDTTYTVLVHSSGHQRHSGGHLDIIIIEMVAAQTAELVLCSAPSVPQPVFTITEKAPTRAFSWFKVPTSAFTFKTLLRHYAKWALTPQ